VDRLFKEVEGLAEGQTRATGGAFREGRFDARAEASRQIRDERQGIGSQDLGKARPGPRLDPHIPRLTSCR
jgi:hypothetical protein